MMSFSEIATPIGRLLLSGDEQGLRGVSFQNGSHPVRPDPAWRETRDPFRDAIAQLEAYFAGERIRFDLPLAPRGTTFQLEVWSFLQTIPYGETTTYAEIARRLGRRAAFRAVGAANGQNPIPIIVPCHRVLGSDGSLTGFGGGLPIKRALLSLESGRPDLQRSTTALLPFDEGRRSAP